ncbi:MAG: hypothetical protein ACREQ5_20025, partial [Candidatus Dormibacteria bacterium]
GGLFVQNTPTISLRVPAGWHVVTQQSARKQGAQAGHITLAGPKGATFDFQWTSQATGDSCLTEPCDAASPAPLKTTFDGEPATLFAWLHGNGVLNLAPVEEAVSSRLWYFFGECQPASPSEESVCGDIVSSISFSAPLFVHQRPDMVVVTIQ